MTRRALVSLLFAALGCASIPGPKQPDESRRVPVNKVLPPELSKAVKESHGRSPSDGAEVLWR